jgi:predicted acetyltransferase
MAVLLASEGLIYRRFGYGVATMWMTAELDRRHSAFLHPVTAGGRVRLVDEDAARKFLPDVFDRARRLQPGAVQRVDAWWPDQLFWREADERGARFAAVYEAPGGTLDGYVVYRVDRRWDHFGRNTLVVEDLVSVSPGARAVLWRFVCDVDLIETIRVLGMPVDDPLRWLLVDSRRLRVTRLADALWVRILDSETALELRGYAASGRLVLDVHDELRPDGDAVGRFALDAGPDGATATRTTSEADLVLDIADLGAAYLGGVTFSSLARAGLVEERTPGALARADAMFHCEPQPYAMTWF